MSSSPACFTKPDYALSGPDQPKHQPGPRFLLCRDEQVGEAPTVSEQWPSAAVSWAARGHSAETGGGAACGGVKRQVDRLQERPTMTSPPRRCARRRPATIRAVWALWRNPHILL